MIPSTTAISPSIDPASAPIRFTAIAYSGGIVPSYGYMGDIAIDLASLQNPDGARLPVLIDHDSRINAIAGSGSIARFTRADGGTELHLTGELTAATAAGQRIAELMQSGYPLQMSVGMSANMRETSQPVDINGQRLAVAAVFENALIREVSFVAVGADPNTHARQSLGAVPSFTPPPTPANRKEAPMSRTAEDQALIDGLNADVARLNQQITDLHTAASAAATAQRSADLSALFAELGRDAPTGDAAQPYLDMSAASYGAFAADLRAAAQSARKADRALFSAQGAQHGAGAAGSDKAGAALLAAVQALGTAPATRI